MISNEFSRLDALGLAQLVKDGQIAAHELVEEAIKRIEALDARINAVPIKLYELARKLARTTLPDGPFHGIPFLAKDLATQWQGLPVTNASHYFRNYVASHDMEIIRRIKRAGIVVVGKSNSPENGWSLATEPKLYGPTRNPWNEAYSAGGSSGGSAAAVAARMVPLADASDGAGSIRVPASNTGLVGLKPSRGRISFGPQFADFWHGGSSFLCVSRSVRDTAAYLDVIGGAMPGDPYELPMPEQTYSQALNDRPRRLRIGYTTTTPSGDPIHVENRTAVEAAAKLCDELGHEVEEMQMNIDDRAVFDNYVKITAVATAAQFAAAEADIGSPVKPADVEPTTWAVIQRGRGISGMSHESHVERMRYDGRAIAARLRSFDVFLTPTLPVPPRPLGWFDMSEPDIDVYNGKMRDDCAFTALFNVSGQPAMSLPLHWTAEDLPVGVQLIGRIGDERTLIMLAGEIEQARPWRHRLPTISA